MRAGVAIKPGTPVDVLYDILDNPNKEEVPDVSAFFGLAICDRSIFSCPPR